MVFRVIARRKIEDMGPWEWKDVNVVKRCCWAECFNYSVTPFDHSRLTPLYQPTEDIASSMGLNKTLVKTAERLPTDVCWRGWDFEGERRHFKKSLEGIKLIKWPFLFWKGRTTNGLLSGGTRYTTQSYDWEQLVAFWGGVMVLVNLKTARWLARLTDVTYFLACTKSPHANTFTDLLQEAQTVSYHITILFQVP